MLNAIRMECYRLWKTKSLYVIWLVMGIAILFTTNLNASDWKSYTAEEKQESCEAVKALQKPENMSFGLYVNLPTEPGEKVTIFDSVYANLQGKFIALFMVIFAVLYSTADMTSGYVKNIAGQVRRRKSLITAKAVGLFVFTVCTMMVYVLIQAISNVICFGSLHWGNREQLLGYLGVQILLHFALNLLVMLIAIITRSTVFSMTFCVCISMNLMTIFYSFLDKGIAKLGVDGFHTVAYTLTGRISMLDMEVWTKQGGVALLIAVMFGVISVLLTGIVFQKRDI